MMVKIFETLGKIIPEILKPQVIFFFNYAVKNGGVSTSEFQHKLETEIVGPLYLSTKGLKCPIKLRDIA